LLLLTPLVSGVQLRSPKKTFTSLPSMPVLVDIIALLNIGLVGILT
jgi:hypothetical protein